ncbi:MAG TPA: hypothetical protein VIV60_37525 [Polyangiaceae bacterium]
MNRFTMALVLGIVAGTVDVLPMVALKSSPWAMASAFTHWLVVAVLVVYVRAAFLPWLKGLLVGAASAVPVMLMVFPVDPTGIGPITLMSLLLGTGVGYASGRLGIG